MRNKIKILLSFFVGFFAASIVVLVLSLIGFIGNMVYSYMFSVNPLCVKIIGQHLSKFDTWTSLIILHLFLAIGIVFLFVGIIVSANLLTDLGRYIIKKLSKKRK